MIRTSGLGRARADDSVTHLMKVHGCEQRNVRGIVEGQKVKFGRRRQTIATLQIKTLE